MKLRASVKAKVYNVSHSVNPLLIIHYIWMEGEVYVCSLLFVKNNLSNEFFMFPSQRQTCQWLVTVLTSSFEKGEGVPALYFSGMEVNIWSLLFVKDNLINEYFMFPKQWQTCDCFTPLQMGRV